MVTTTSKVGVELRATSFSISVRRVAGDDDLDFRGGDSWHGDRHHRGDNRSAAAILDFKFSK